MSGRDANQLAADVRTLDRFHGGERYLDKEADLAWGRVVGLYAAALADTGGDTAHTAGCSWHYTADHCNCGAGGDTA